MSAPTWVYKRSPSAGVYTVGYFAPSGTWMPASDHATEDGAIAEVKELNGGTSASALELLERIAIALEEAIPTLEHIEGNLRVVGRSGPI